MTFSITINKTRHSAYQHLASWQSVVMLNVTNKIFMLSVIMLNVVMLSVVVPNVLLE
jgi:hypothetical protein